MFVKSYSNKIVVTKMLGHYVKSKSNQSTVTSNHLKPIVYFIEYSTKTIMLNKEA